jgi:hypothetical protein
MSKFYIGLDLGQMQDYTALVIIERIGGDEKEKPEYHVRKVERFKLGTPYPAIVTRIEEIMAKKTMKGSVLVVDATGVGRAVVDLFRNRGLHPKAITITGGDAVSRDCSSDEYRVPKRDLISNLQVLFQEGKLKIAEQIPEAQLLIQELLNFKVKINVTTGHDSYEALREGVHDDFVLAAALACWFCKNGGSGAFFI